MSETSFGPFLLDPSSTRLLRDGVEVKLRPQAFQALRTLLRHSGQSIGYEQMMAEAWEGTFVSRHTVDVTIGESPVTVIVSSIEPTFRSASTVAVNVPGSSTPSRRTDWKPANVKLTVYVPGRRSTMR